jgi:dienelactone hydrolase
MNLDTQPFSSSLRFQCSDGLWLNASFVNPEGSAAAVLILPGSGNVGMDGDVSSPFVGDTSDSEHAKLSVQISRALAAAGVSSLVYEKRGYADPELRAEQRFPQLVYDAVSAAQFLRELVGSSAKIFLLGFSEGALTACLAESQIAPAGLFLLGFPHLEIDKLLRYQFIDWPISYIQKQRLGGSTKLVAPMLGPDFRSKTVELEPGTSAMGIFAAYDSLHLTIKQIVESPQMRGWYEGMRAVPAAADLASSVTCPVFVYHGIEDSQVPWEGLDQVAAHFQNLRALRCYAGVGHCFSEYSHDRPYLKTAGPIGENVITDLVTDVTQEAAKSKAAERNFPSSSLATTNV